MFTSGAFLLEECGYSGPLAEGGREAFLVKGWMCIMLFCGKGGGRGKPEWVYYGH